VGFSEAFSGAMWQCCCRMCFLTQLHPVSFLCQPAAPDDHLVSVGWSPLGCRHLLLTVTQQGSVVVWGQTPTEPPQDEGPQPESAATPSQQQPQPSTHSTAHPTVHSLNDWYPQRLAFSPPSDADQYAPPPSQPAAGLWGAAGVPGGTSGVVAGRQSLNPATSVDDFLADPHAVPGECANCWVVATLTSFMGWGTETGRGGWWRLPRNHFTMPRFDFR
jgi:hypothetical protein